MVKTTIIIPNYNGIKYIENCLNSIYESDSLQFHIIMVDNASKDGSLELVREKFPEVELICNQENEGFSKAVNQGILASKTPYVFLLNNDTVVAKDFLTVLEKTLDADPEIFSASAKMVSLHDQTKIDDAGDFYCALGWPYAKGKGKSPEQFQSDYEIFASCAGAAIYRKEYFAKVGLFDENHFAYFEDIDLGYRARIQGYRNVFAAGAVIFHAGSATSGSRYNEFKINLASRNSIYLIYKNMPFVQLLINLPFLCVGYIVKTLYFVKKGFGLCYIKGIGKGFSLAASKEGKAHKVAFSWRNLKNYCKIQLELWRNMFFVLS